jgi:branched-chain amino acid transport system substrate-binding protein
VDQPRRVQAALPRRVVPAALLAALLAATACGTRVERPRAAPVLPSVPGAADGPVTEPAPGDDTAAPPATTETTAAGGAAAPAPIARPGRAAGSAGPAASPTTAPAGAPRSTSAAVAPPKASEQRSAPSAKALPPPVGETPPGKKSPAIFANVGTHSGVGGATLFPVVQGVQVWVQHINARGGLNGHEVKLILFDDGGDPARHRAQVQEAIERHKAIAFLGNTEVLSGRGSVEYLTQKRVPVVGMDTGEPWAYQSPMYFPQSSAGDALTYTFVASIAQLMVPAGKKKLGTLVCAEAQICTDADRIFGDNAPKLGFDHVYRAKASLTQPDFTAECLAARNAGVEVFFIMLVTNTTQRAAASCARQGYRPNFATASAIVADRLKDDPNFDGLVAPSQVFPWYQTGTPATDEYQQAMRTFGKDVAPGAAPPVGWAAGKLMERAAANLPEPPTSAAILEGLWALKADTLGGITAPLTFVRDQPPTPVSCWFNMAIRDGAWVSPDGFRMHCR